MSRFARILTALIVGLALPAAAAAQDTWTATNSATAPTPRTVHTSVWTGSEMIVWGGTDVSGTVFNSGSRYNPIADSWNPTTTTAAPTARYGHTAVWTGSRMIVWGGSTANAGTVIPTNTGFSYDPVSDAWTPISSAGAPAARFQHAAVWTGREMLVWGGRDNAVSFNSGGRYDPVTDSWTPMAPAGAPAVRDSYPSAVWTGRELLIWGGRNPGTTTEVSTGGRYDPELDQWAAVSSAGSPRARGYHSSVWTGREMLVWGGASATSAGSGDSYDPVSDSWTPITTVNAPAPRWYAGAVWTGRGMLVFGGYATGTFTSLNSGAIYDPALKTWTAISAVGSPAVASHSTLWTGREMIIWGGVFGPTTAVNTGGRYLPVADPQDRWATITTTGAPTPRGWHSAVWSGREMLVWGGTGPAAFGPGKKYDPRTESWTNMTVTNVPTDRFGQTAVWTDREMIVWGGDDGALGTNTGARYDPVSDSWTATTLTGAPSARRVHTAVWTGREMIVWGGVGPGASLGDGARYDPRSNTWAPVSSTGAPLARQFHTAVWTGRVMIIWGGVNTPGTGTFDLNDGASYDPATDTWTALTTTGAPSARSAHPAIWTGDRMIVWGGGNTATGAAYFPVTNSWTALPTSPLAPKNGHTAVWTGSEMIVWGGIGGPFQNTGARYSPTGNSWTATTTTAAPLARDSHVAVWTGSRMIVWGGRIGTIPNTYTDTGGCYGGDDTLPTAGVVYDGLGADLIVQIDTTSLSANWAGFTDAESGIVRYEWALGTSPGATDLQAFVDIGTATSATASGLSLTVGTTCYATVRATNGDGRIVTATSNGVYIGSDMSAKTGCAGSVGAPGGFPVAIVALVLLLLLRWKG